MRLSYEKTILVPMVVSSSARITTEFKLLGMRMGSEEFGLGAGVGKKISSVTKH